MKIYVDENLEDKTLVALLTKAGHTVVSPLAVSLRGKSDARQLQHAIEKNLVMLTSDRDDFRDLHFLVLASGGGHSGILVVMFENDPSKDLHPKHIASAIGKLERAALDLANELVTLNHWR
jgi:predicted nuclease of predicted toxin-antitoxin system